MARLPRRRLLRYAGVSTVATITTLTVLAVLVATELLTPGWANIVATAAGTVPSFELNRRWVWRKAGRRSLLRETVPFVALSFVGLVLSSLVVKAATSWAVNVGLSTAARAMTADTANLATFACLWVVQYFVLDRVLFRTLPIPEGSRQSKRPSSGPA
jgi:putative flippase GtrA